MVEEQVRNLIKQEFGSVKRFSAIIGLPYTTVVSILNRGLGNASLTHVFAICSALRISADELAKGRVVPCHIMELSLSDEKILRSIHSLNEEGQEEVIKYIDYLQSKDQYKKCNFTTMVEEA